MVSVLLKLSLRMPVFCWPPQLVDTSLFSGFSGAPFSLLLSHPAIVLLQFHCLFLPRVSEFLEGRDRILLIKGIIIRIRMIIITVTATFILHFLCARLPRYFTYVY